MLKQRILSAIVMAPPALAAMWYGGWAFAGLALVIGVVMAWEWERLVTGRQFGVGFAITAAVTVLTGVLALVQPAGAVAAVAVGVAAMWGVAAARRDAAAGWLALGVAYVALPVAALIWMRDDPELGRALIFWVLLVVWATDIGGYAFGRTIGGPKLAPRLSPKKTWAGLLGGMLSAVLVGWACAAAAGFAPRAPLIAFVSAVLAVIAQAGDIFESSVKRRFGVKDSSAIIPGHGGMLDRVDGVLPVAVVVAAMVWLNVDGDW